MLQTTLTNLRTLSFAFVMAAMLMVGTMVPVQQAAAQEPSVEQRAAMFAQINQLMQLITQLMTQLQMMQSGVVATPAEPPQNDFSLPSEANPLASIQFTDRDAYVQSIDNSGAEWGRFLVEFEVTADDEDIWIKNSLYRVDDKHSAGNRAKYNQNPKFSAVKNGERIKSGFGEHYTFMQPGFLSDAEEALPVTSEKNENYYVVKQGTTETFTVNVMFAVQESGTYSIKLESPLPIQTPSGKKSVLSINESQFTSDSLALRSKGVEKDTQAQAELQRVIDQLNSIGKKDKEDIKEDIDDVREELEEYEERYEDLYQEAREYDLEAEIADLLEEVDWYLDEAQEQYEDEDYVLAEDNLEEAEDLLDGLNDVLDDIEDGRVEAGGLQSTIDDLIEQVADASNSNETAENTNDLQEQIDRLLEMIEDPQSVPSASKRNQMSELELQAVIGDLMAQMAQQDGRGTPDDSQMSQDFWDVDRNDAVMVVGAYQGTYPGGASRGFRQHPQGEVIVNMTKQAGWQEDTMLILTSYEPVKWVLTGDAVDDAVTLVFLSGYYDQEVTGVSSDVEVIHMSHESGDRDYYYAYERDSRNYNELQDFFKDQTGREFDNFTGKYSLEEVSIGLKG
jgi:hypothetical protein